MSAELLQIVDRKDRQISWQVYQDMKHITLMLSTFRDKNLRRIFLFSTTQLVDYRRDRGCEVL
jgi:hypothetical protein